MKFATVIYTQDVRAALEFYQRAFGLATRFYDDAYDYGELDVDGAILGIASHSLGELVMPGTYRASDGGDRGTSIEISFIVEDVTQAFEQALAAGADALARPKRMPWGAIVAYLRSPEGTLIGLSTSVNADA
ncbi:MAG: VOC family protein [Anaerolineae bacterium]|nr:VOC family protein [Anaerolineae bacterium]